MIVQEPGSVVNKRISNVKPDKILEFLAGEQINYVTIEAHVC